ncbi:MAG TPA: folate-binding protein, partial [Xanthobacteraceae bacterium]|nr:folate-binding protein [Xanthobacteraceae bacterium]
VAFEDFAAEAGVVVKAGDTDIGLMGTSVRGGGRGLAMLRLDRVGDALAAGTPLMSGGMMLRPVKPAWARFAWPGEAKARE